MLEVIETARKIAGQPIEVRMEARRAGDPSALVASSEKARRMLGWQPKYPELEEIIGSAWCWHRVHPRGYATQATA